MLFGRNVFLNGLANQIECLVPFINSIYFLKEAAEFECLNSLRMNEILYVILDHFASHEIVFLSQPINCDATSMKSNPKYVNKIVSYTLNPVQSIDGFRILPDYTFDNVPDQYSALILIGGFSWETTIAEKVVPLIQHAIEKQILVGAICNAAAFLGKWGFLNNVKHTANSLEQLKAWGSEKYTNEAGFLRQNAVSDHNIVTAHGTAYLEFAREILLLLKNDTEENIEMYYQFFKKGALAFQ